MERRCSEEVVRLHQFFQEWFNAAVEPTEEEFHRFSSVMAEGFAIISPNGRMTERAELEQRLRSAHGAWSRSDPPGRIWIENFQVRHEADDLALVVYEEWQEVEGETRGRLSTALLRYREESANSLEWVHVHEVWLPEQEPAR